VASCQNYIFVPACVVLEVLKRHVELAMGVPLEMDIKIPGTYKKYLGKNIFYTFKY
jgi:hypothetical protein